MKHTGIPYFEAHEESEDWYVLSCDLCFWNTKAGYFHDAEFAAQDHLDEEHPAEKKAAYEKIQARAKRFQEEGPFFAEDNEGEK